MLALDSRLVIAREAAEEVASTAVAAGRTHQAQAIDIQRFVAAGRNPVAMQLDTAERFQEEELRRQPLILRQEA